MRHLRLLIGAWSLVLLASTYGCSRGAQPEPVFGTVKIQEVQFLAADASGNPVSSRLSLDEETLLSVMASRPQRWNPLEAERFFNPMAASGDVARLRTLLHARGYLDAQVFEPEVVVLEDRSRAFLRYRIHEGEPYTVARYVIPTDRMRQALDTDPELLTRGLGLQVGQTFSLERFEEARQTMRRRLMESTYAYARVDMRVFVFRDRREVEVYYFAEPGVSCVFGDIEVRGTRRIPEELIVGLLPFRTATVTRSDDVTDRRERRAMLFRPSVLRTAQRRLYDTGAFSFVSVESQLSDESRRAWEGERPSDALRHDPLRELFASVGASVADEGGELAWDIQTWLDEEDVAQGLFGGTRARNPRVPILITVSEYPRATYRAGAGTGLESGRTEAYGRGHAIWRNFLAPMNRLELEVVGGYAWLPSIVQINQEGPIGRARLGYSRPNAVFGFFDFSLTTRVEAGLEQEYRYYSPQGRVGLGRRLTQHMTLDFGYNIDLFLITEDALSGVQTTQNLPSQFRLGYLDVTLRYDRRDNPLQTLRGYLGELVLHLGEPWVLGDYAYLKVQPDVRVYIPIGRSLTLASRLKLGSIFTLADPPVLRTQRFYAGGGDSFRGLPRRRLSTHEFLRSDGTTTSDPSCVLGLPEFRCRPVPIGAFSQTLFSLEPRFELQRGWLYGVWFLDVGATSTESFAFPTHFEDDGWQAATGPGIRFVTPIGPIRSDFGYRLTEGIQFADLRSRFTFFLSIGEAF